MNGNNHFKNHTFFPSILERNGRNPISKIKFPVFSLSYLRNLPVE